jgi:hypothetical protein
MIEGKNGIFLFLVDRNKVKEKWWTTNLNQAIQFQKHTAAEIQAKKLNFGNPEVVNYDTALKLVMENERNYDYNKEEHIFSNEAFKQS